MPFCENCGQQIAENQKFCPNCGARNELAFKAQGTTSPPPPPPGHTSNVPPPPPPKKLIDLEIDQQDIDKGVEKARRGLGAAFSFAKKGLSRGAEIAGKGIEAAKDTIEERRAAQTGGQPPAEGGRVCPSCGQPVTGSGKFCNHCGQKLE